MSTGSESPRFERVDWTEVDRSRPRLTAERLTVLVGAIALFGLYLYDTYVTGLYVISTWRLEAVDWVFLVSIVLLLGYGVVPAIKRPTLLRRVLARLGSNPATLLAGTYLLAVLLVGIVGPAVLGVSRLQFQHGFHPPVGFTVDGGIGPLECLGGETGEVFETRCSGSWAYPLGTNERGHPMGYLLVTGARVALYVLAFTAAFVVPIAAAVGVVAGLYGGVIDDLLMSYVDVQLSIPAMIIYLIGYMYWNPSLLLLLVTFGLLSWGGIARLVRSEVLQRREDGYVLVAKSLGASRSYVARRHIVPNSTNTIVPAVFQLMALLVIIEAGIAFLGFHDLEFYSWGSTIAESVNAQVPATLQSRADVPAYEIWWVSTLPAIALTGTVLSLKVLGDGIRDALDPRGEQ
ncbi:MAG: ABC transporter permease [Halobacteriota archaeon]